MSFQICYEYFATVTPPDEIFQFHKTDLPCHVISLALKIVISSVSIATKLTISNIYTLIRLRFEQPEHRNSQCVVEHTTSVPRVYFRFIIKS